MSNFKKNKIIRLIKLTTPIKKTKLEINERDAHDDEKNGGKNK